MAIDYAELAGHAAKAGGATAGFGAGGGLTYEFFEKAHGGDLIMLGNAYGLTAFAFIALILLVSAFVSLPATTSNQVRRGVLGALGVFALLSIGCFVFQIVAQGDNPPVTLNIAFAPDLHRLNDRFHLTKDVALQVSVDDHRGKGPIPVDKHDVPVTVYAGTEVTVEVDQLPDALQHVIETRVAKVACPGAAPCNLKSTGGDDVAPH
jgi:hypothetical protein